MPQRIHHWPQSPWLVLGCSRLHLLLAPSLKACVVLLLCITLCFVLSVLLLLLLLLIANPAHSNRSLALQALYSLSGHNRDNHPSAPTIHSHPSFVSRQRFGLKSWECPAFLSFLPIYPNSLHLTVPG